MATEQKDRKITDSIPRATLLQIFQVLGHLASSGGKSTFEQVRLFLLRRSQRSAPSSRVAMYTVARDVLVDLQRLAFIEAGVLPRTQSTAQSHADTPCALTETGRALAHLYKERPGRAFDQMLLAWITHHPYFRAFITRLRQQPLYVPNITSVKQLGAEMRSEENLDTLARRITEHCVKRLSVTSFSPAKVEAFTYAVGERVQELGRTALSGLDVKKWVDVIEDRVVIPAFLTAESMPFSDAVTFQHILKAAKDFLAASWTTAHPEFSLRVIFPTCEFRPPVAEAPPGCVTEVVHHGKSFAAAGFVSALRAAYDRVATPPGSDASAYAVRAIVCIALQIQPKVFASCLGDLVAAGPTSELTIYIELPFDPPPSGEDYLEIDHNRIGLLRLTFSN